ncbi:hypothetical protein ASG40_09640 [Methylobacterium sp. Leaf399]|uniref:hypothetical protein n=1 Tax=Methylobacterium sp. Leaf399 TaxID=1736364 RepID=UPI0006F88D54|nr:hypothetical protein [Methylobacterium sp. Leaf399]KQT09975.1 hypothetical protein ASG40_09640 [Methylobacterium sp. Leaf399]
MPVESWTRPDDVPALAAQARTYIDAALARLDEAERQAFWASIVKCYNTPYNDPEPRALVRPAPAPAPVRIVLADETPDGEGPVEAADLAHLAAIPAASGPVDHHVR